MKYISLFLLIVLPIAMAQAQARGNMRTQVRGYGNQSYQENLSNDFSILNQSTGHSSSVQRDDRFTMEVQVLNNVVADFQIVIFNVTQIGKTAEEAEQFATERIDGLIQDLAQVGIPAEDVFQDIISFAPYYSTSRRFFTNTMVKRPAGFELQKNLHIRYSDSDLLNRILTKAASHEIYDLIRVEYYVEDIAQVYHDMRLQAIEEVMRRQQAYQSVGMDLSAVHRKLAEGHRAYMPQERYLDYTGVTLIAKEEKTEGDNEAEEFRNPETAFYAPLSYQNFDVVMNPVIFEPVVQFTYSLTVDFEYPYRAPEEEASERVVMEEPDPVKQFYLVTPAGEIKFITESD